MNLTTPKKRTITLTARPPISVNEECPSCNPKSDAERPDPQVMISNEQWRENGSEYGDKPWARLITTLRVNGVAFHLEAIAVEEDAKCTLVACDPAFESDLNALADLAEPSGQWDTMPIRRNGIEREYVVFATPHC